MTALSTFSSTFRVMDGATDVTTGHGVIFSVLSENGCDASINPSTGVFTLNSVTSDSASATFKAVYNGRDIIRTFDVAKARQGDDGTPAKLMWITTTAQTVNYNSDGSTLNPSNQDIVLQAYKQGTTATVNWSATDANGAAVGTPQTGDSLTISSSSFATLFNGTTSFKIKGSITDGVTISDHISVGKIVAGAIGASAKLVTITGTGQVFTFDNSTTFSSGAPASIVLTAALQSTGSTVNWSAADASGAVSLSGWTSTATTLTVSQANFGTTRNWLKITATSATDGSISDSFTIYKIGHGINALQGVLSNEAHSVPTDSAGNSGDFSNATGTFKVYYGGVDVTASATLAAGTATGCTAQLNTVTNSAFTGVKGAYRATAMSADTATFVMTASYVVGGLTLTTSGTFSLSKSKTGQTGGPGTAGSNNATAVLFQRAASTPSIPGSTLTYTFSTGLLSGILGSWTQTVPAGSNPLYRIQANASSNTTTDTIGTAEWSSPVIEAEHGKPGPAIVLTPSAGAVTYQNGVSTGSQTITITATLQNVSGTITWSTVPASVGTAGSTTYTLNDTHFASRNSVVVTATIGTVSQSVTITRQDTLSSDFLSTISYNANDARDANGTILDISADGVISIKEKKTRVVPMWNTVQANYTKWRAEAVSRGVSVTAFDAAYTQLQTYIASYSSMLDTTRATYATNDFNNYIANYYKEEEAVAVACNPVAYHQTTAPTTPKNGDTWVDTSLTPNVSKVRVAGAWQNSSNLTTQGSHIGVANNAGSSLELVAVTPSAWSFTGNTANYLTQGTWRSFYSRDGLPGAVTVSGCFDAGNSWQQIGIGAGISTVDGSDPTFPWFMLYNRGGSVGFYGSCGIIDGVATTTPTDVWAVQTDNVSVRFLKNGAQIGSFNLAALGVASNLTWRASGAVLWGSKISSIQFGAATDNYWPNFGGPGLPADNSGTSISLNKFSANLIVKGNSIRHVSYGSWHPFYSAETAPNAAFVSFKPSQPDLQIMGLGVEVPSSDSTENHYALSLYNMQGVMCLFSSHTGFVYNIGTVLAGDVWSIDCDNINARFYQTSVNGASTTTYIRHTFALPSNLRNRTWRVTGSIYSGSFDSILFMKGTDNDFGNFGGATKPENNATVGGEVGTNIKIGGAVAPAKRLDNYATRIHGSGGHLYLTAEGDVAIDNVPLSEAGIAALAYKSAASMDSDVTDGATYARPLASEMTGGAHKLGIAGSGKKLGDARQLPNVNAMNLGYKWPTAPSYTSTPTSATISVPATTLISGSVSVSYNASSVGVSGSPGTVVPLYLYLDDPTNAGGSRTLAATSVGSTVYQSDSRVFVGAIEVSFPSSGTGSGEGEGGGGNCVAADAWVETFDRGFVPAREVQPGDSIRVLADDMESTDWELVTSNMLAPARGWLLTSASGIKLTLSDATPITLRDRSMIRVDQIDGHELPVQCAKGFRWEPCQAEPVGGVMVAHIRVSQKTYAAGDVPGRSILTHNPFNSSKP